jgi:hypothetical protein
MSDLFARVNSVPNICGIDLAFSGFMLPSFLDSYNRFFDAIPVGTNFQEVYFGKASVGFDEESDDTAAGPSYKQTVTIQFPTADTQRSLRLSMMHKVRFVRLKLNNGTALVIGRNDFEQNARPRIQSKTNERLGQVTFTTVSIFPTGYSMPIPQGVLPQTFPVNLIDPD